MFGSVNELRTSRVMLSRLPPFTWQPTQGDYKVDTVKTRDPGDKFVPLVLWELVRGVRVVARVSGGTGSSAGSLAHTPADGHDSQIEMNDCPKYIVITRWKVRAYGFSYSRVVEYHPTNEWIKAIQSTFHGVFCLLYTYSVRLLVGGEPHCFPTRVGEVRGRGAWARCVGEVRGRGASSGKRRRKCLAKSPSPWGLTPPLPPLAREVWRVTLP